MAYLDLYRTRIQNTIGSTSDPNASPKKLILEKQFKKYFNTTPNRFSLLKVTYDLLSARTDDPFNGVLQSIRHGEEESDSKLLIVEDATVINTGDEIFWSDEYWIVINREHRVIQTHKTYVMQVCNNKIKFKTEDNEIFEQNVIIENLRNKAFSMQETYFLTLGARELFMTIPNNAKTQKIGRETRIAVGRNVYKVISFDDYSSADGGLIRLSMIEDKETDMDDVLNGLAENIDHSPEAATGSVIQGSLDVTVGYSETYTATGAIGETFAFSVDTLSTPVGAYTVNVVDGNNVEILANEFMDTDYNVYGIKLIATNNTTSVQSELTLKFKGLQ